MIARKFVFLAPVGLCLALVACSKSGKEEIAANYCPRAFGVQDVDRLTRFKPGPGRDARDIVFEAALGGANTSCELRAKDLEVELKVRVAATAGPAIGPGITSVPYFVRLINAKGTVVQGREFNADFKLSQANPRGASLEDLTLRLPFSDPSDLGGYTIAVGLKPTPQELEYNRRTAR